MKFLRRSGAIAAVAAAALMSQNASAVNLATDGVGEVAIAPYYTVRNGWLTTINLTNTTLEPIAVKIRLHEARNSRDVLDFIVAMSGADQFTAVIQDTDAGPTLFVRDDADADGRKTCTVPNSVGLNNTNGADQGTRLLTGAYGPADSINDDGGPLGVDRLREGYIEFIVLGFADGDKTGDLIGGNDEILIGNAIEQHACAQIQTAFGNNTNNTTSVRRIVETAQQFGEPINALKFNFRLLNPSLGMEAGSTSATWANFYNPDGAEDGAIQPADNALCEVTRGDQRETSTVTTFADWQPDGGNDSCRNLIATQTPNAFLEPTLNDAFPEVANWWDDTLNAPLSLIPTEGTPLNYNLPNNVRGVDAVSATIQRSAIINEWASDTDGLLGERTDWIITLPTKSFYVDYTSNSPTGVAGQQAGVSPQYGTGTNGGGAALEGLYTNINTARPESILDETGGTAAANGTFPPYRPFENAYEPAATRPETRACNTIGFVVYDRAEQFLGDVDPGDGVVVSPGTPETVDETELCYEANVVTFNGESVLFTNPATALNIVTDGSDGNPAPLASKRGWMKFQLDNFPDAVLAVNGLPGLATGLRGLPVIGTMVKSRTFGDVTKNFASGTDHAYSRTLETP